MNRSERIWRNLVRVLLVVFACSLIIGVLCDHEPAESTSLRNLRHAVAVETGRRHVARNPDPNYTSKRRIPTGPDPFHNRHIGEAKRRPGRV